MAIKFYLVLIVVCLWYRDTSVYAEDAEDDYYGKLENKLVVDEMVEEIPAPDLVNVDLNFKEGENMVVVNGEIKLFTDVDDDYKFEIAIAYANISDKDYRTFFTFPKLGTCVVMRDLYKPLLYDIAKDYSNAPDPDICPVVKDTFVINDLPLDTSLLQDLLLPGRYRTDCTIYKNMEVVAKFQLFFRIEKIKP